MKEEATASVQEEYDVVIIGAGPAGLSCAIELQSTNLKVLVLEKNSVIGPKICAGGLTTKIRNFGIPLEMADILFYSIVGSVSKKSILFPTGKMPFLGTIDRKKLGQFLAGEISNKITVKTGCNVSAIGEDFIVAEGRKIKYKYLVGADGSNSVVRKFLGIKKEKFLTAIQYLIPGDYKDIEVHMDAKLFGSGYSWVFPHKNYASVGCCQHTEDGRWKTSLKERLDSWVEGKGFLMDGSEFQGWTINFDYQGFDFGNKFLVGDAGGFSSGLTGEGIYFALVSGQEVAKKIINPKYDCVGIRDILCIKRNHEFILKFISCFVRINRTLANLFLKSVLILCKNKNFLKRVLQKYV